MHASKSAEQRRRSQTGASEGQLGGLGTVTGGGQGGTHQIVRHRRRLFLIPRSTRRRISLQRMRHCYYYQRCSAAGVSGDCVGRWVRASNGVRAAATGPGPAA